MISHRIRSLRGRAICETLLLPIFPGVAGGAVCANHVTLQSEPGNTYALDVAEDSPLCVALARADAACNAKCRSGDPSQTWPETWTAIPSWCPVCDCPTVGDHYLDSSRGPGWRCSADPMHYWMVRMEPLRRWLTAHPPPPQYPWYGTPSDERQAWLEAHAYPPRLAPRPSSRATDAWWIAMIAKTHLFSK